jgi:hypothetical protein
MAIDWAEWQALSVGVVLAAALLPGATRSLRRWQIRARLRQNLDLASAVREHGSSAELDPVLTELITDNLIELAQLEERRLRAAPTTAAWKAIQVVSVIGWAFAAVLAVRSTAGLAHNVGGLIVFALAVDVPLLFLAIVGRDLVRRRLRRGRRPEPVPKEVTLAEQTHDLAEELATTLALGRRETLRAVLQHRADLGPQWRVGRAAVPPSF